MRFFFDTFVKDVRRRYNSILDKGIKTWDAFHKLFIKIWCTKGDPNMLLLQFSEMKKKENEIVKEFDTRFEMLLQQILDNIIPKDDAILLLYVNTYVGQFGFVLKDKFPKTLEEAQEKATSIKENLSSTKVEAFYVPRAKVETKPRTLHSTEPTQDIGTPRAQKIEESINGLAQTQTLLVNKVTNMERIQ
jgi:hypothetical protein